jgi:hypothetical protein
LPSINALHEDFQSRGLTVLLVNMREDRETVRRAVTTKGYTAPVLLDTDGMVANAYRVTGTPTVFLLDRHLQVAGRAIGRRQWATDEVRRLLGAVLATAPAGRP